ncbi:PREDICTED: nuclear valosin-containing protein-like [Thamnophis sirtalis]|uniref:Nuclear valosin-containing protein-like n=1 Tax=Thamnophis sirtalis TaxID=35019 RepID=A0A6I9YQ43_9SAUR|nr:PREDICTED: nuclear valosin-containing protein-like [Thamnophis sirtalis]
MRNRGGNHPSGGDPRLKQRVKQYLSSNKCGQYVNTEILAAELQKIYRILKTLCRKLRLQEPFDFGHLAHVTPGYVGADLLALCREAAMCTVNRVLVKLNGKKWDVTKNEEATPGPDMQRRTEENVKEDAEEPDLPSEIKKSIKNKDHLEKAILAVIFNELQRLLQLLKEPDPLGEAQLQKLCIELKDFTVALSSVQPSAKREGFVTVPDVTWADIGALEEVREELTMAILNTGNISVLETARKKSKNKKYKRRKVEFSNVDEEIESVLKQQKVKSREIELQTSSMTFEDIGGNDEILKEICKMLIHIRHPEVYTHLGAVPPRGFLLHGPPGCGKTLLAQAIAGELELPILKVAATEVVSGVSGDSEQKLRELFDQAVTNAPCILFIDEIDAITPKREIASKDMERRIVAQLLTCMDGLYFNSLTEYCGQAAAVAENGLSRTGGSAEQVAPVRNPEQFRALGLLAPAGVLLAGPPGCGKTLLAKAVANESGLNFISVKGPELLNMYVGESERAVRQVFQRARNSAPCVIFFDEVDALCPRRSDRESGASVRVVNQLLTEMDGLESRRQVFIMAATNRPDIIDPAILRPGRLDKTLYVGLPPPLDRLAILKTITKDGTVPPLDTDVHLEEIADNPCCDCFTGADLSALVREASVCALKQQMTLFSPANKNMSVSCTAVFTGEIRVGKKHFEEAFKKVKSSITKKVSNTFKFSVGDPDCS